MMLVDLVQLHEGMCTVLLCFAPWFPCVLTLSISRILFAVSDSNHRICFQLISGVAANEMQSFEMCNPLETPHAFTCSLYAWVELMTCTTCANCSSIMRRTQQRSGGEWLWPIASNSDKLTHPRQRECVVLLTSLEWLMASRVVFMSGLTVRLLSH